METVKDVVQNWVKDRKRGIEGVHCSKWLGYEMVSEMHKAFHSILAATKVKLILGVHLLCSRMAKNEEIINIKPRKIKVTNRTKT